MTQRLLISPEGVEQTSQVGITEMADPAGQNGVIVRNDAYEVASDGTYENVE
jgi:hypothetical protein